MVLTFRGNFCEYGHACITDAITAGVRSIDIMGTPIQCICSNIAEAGHSEECVSVYHMHTVTMPFAVVIGFLTVHADAIMARVNVEREIAGLLMNLVEADYPPGILVLHRTRFTEFPLVRDVVRKRILTSPLTGAQANIILGLVIIPRSEIESMKIDYTDADDQIAHKRVVGQYQQWLKGGPLNLSFPHTDSCVVSLGIEIARVVKRGFSNDFMYTSVLGYMFDPEFVDTITNK